MSNRLTALAWRTRLGNAAAKAVLVRLCDFADDDGRRVFPAVPTVARDCDLGERTVQEALRRLESARLLILVREADFARRRAREYRINVEALEALAHGGADTRCADRTGAPTAPAQEPHWCASRTQPVRETHQAGAGAAPQPPGDPPVEPPEENRSVNRPDDLFGDAAGEPASDQPHEPDVDALFADWWAEVPRKVAKGTAQRAYRAALKHASPVELLTGIRRFAAEVRGRDEKYIPHPASWLNGQRWLDQPAPQGNEHDQHRDSPREPRRNAWAVAAERLFESRTGSADGPRDG